MHYRLASSRPVYLQGVRRATTRQSRERSRSDLAQTPQGARLGCRINERGRCFRLVCLLQARNRERKLCAKLMWNIFVHFLSPFLSSSFDSYSTSAAVRRQTMRRAAVRRQTRRKQRPLSFILHPRRAPCGKIRGSRFLQSRSWWSPQILILKCIVVESN